MKKIIATILTLSLIMSVFTLPVLAEGKTDTAGKVSNQSELTKSDIDKTKKTSTKSINKLNPQDMTTYSYWNDDFIADYEKNKVVAPKSVLAGKSFTIKLVGDRQDAPYYGSYRETYYDPLTWDILSSSGSVYKEGPVLIDPPYKSSTKVDKPGKYTITGYFLEYVYEYAYEDEEGIWANGDYSEYMAYVNKPLDVKGLVKFDANGGKKVSKTKELSVGQKYGTMPKTTKSKNTLKGWYTKKSGGTKITSSSKANLKKATTTLYARWVKTNQTVKFNANSGKVAKKSKVVKYNQKYGSLPKATRSGYSFKGWYTKKSGGKKITSSSKVTIEKTTTLYAQWKKK